MLRLISNIIDSIKMKTKNIILISVLGMLTLTGCNDYLTQEPLHTFTDSNFWVSEANVRAYAFGYYSDRFAGFGNNDSGGKMFSRQSLNDDFTSNTLPGFSSQPVNKGGLWSSYFSKIRRDNIFVDRLSNVTFTTEQAANHWMGIARFFRALDYSDFVFDFGDVPYYDHELFATSPDLFRERDAATYVMDNVLEDFEYAAQNVYPADDATGLDGLVVNRYVVDAIMSRQLLKVATKLKYDPDTSADDFEKIGVYLQAAKDAANRVIESGKYALAPDYHTLCSTVDITATAAVKKEMIMYRVYDTGLVTHALMSYNNETTAQGVAGTKDLVDTYLCTNGLPIAPKNGANALYKGDKSVETQMANRDPRLAATFRTSRFYIQYDESGYASTGFKCWKFLNEATAGETTATQSFNITDAPVIRLGEIMLNYIEAAAELETMGLYTVVQADLDKTVNKLRARTANTPRLPALQIVGGNPAIKGVVYDDAERDPDVPSFLWEIRRERRVELVYEGFRLDDLKRWRKIDYTNTELYPKKNLGAWITKNSANKALILTDIDGNTVSPANSNGSGYLKVSQTFRNATNGCVLDRAYWECLPIYEIDFYAKNNSYLKQNAGWPQGSNE